MITNMNLLNVDFDSLLNPKKWDSITTEAYKAVDEDIYLWLENNVPTITALLKEASKRKDVLYPLVNAVKATVLFEQLGYVGLKSRQHGQLTNLFYTANTTVSKILLKKSKKHDVTNPCNFVNRSDLVSPNYYNNYFHTIEENLKLVNGFLTQNPSSTYLTLLKNCLEDCMVLKSLFSNIDEITFDPKKSGEYKTCACCFRAVRLKKGSDTIAYHGYKIERDTYNVISDYSCRGSNYKPLNESINGTLVMIGAFKRQLAELNKLFEQTNDSKYKYKIRSIEMYFESAIEFVKVVNPNELDYLLIAINK